MKKLALIFGIVLLIGVLSEVEGQNVAITDDNAYTAHSSAMLDVKSVTKGMLVPRMTTVQRDAIVLPATGLLVFDTNENVFYYYTGSTWSNLSVGQLWSKNGNYVYLSNTDDNVGIGVIAPENKLLVRADASTGIDESVFAVLNNNGDTVFAVYQEGVRIWVNNTGGSKAIGSRGGFAVGGFNPAKAGFTNEYLRVTPDSVRVYIDETYVGAKANGSRGGFAVGGFNPAKGTNTENYMIVSLDTTETIVPSEPRILWYPTKEAFLTGRVIIESKDSIGINSFASGFESKAIGNYSQALGYHARAFGNNSTAIGNNANAEGDDSYSLGNFSKTENTGSYAIGSGARASGLRSFALGSTGVDSAGTATSATIASGDYSYAFGMGSEALSQGAFAFGIQNTASGQYSTAMGYNTNAGGWYSVTMGCRSIASAAYSIALGYESEASGDASLALGYWSIASGDYSTALGSETTASGLFSTAMGFATTASYPTATAMGQSTTASGDGSTAMGYNTTASGGASTAIGNTTTASGNSSFTTGIMTTASELGTTAMGREINVSGEYSFGISLNNPTTDYLVTQINTMAIMGGNVGIGTTAPSNKLEVNGSSANIEISNLLETEAGLIFYDSGYETAQYAKILYNCQTNDLNFYNKSTTPTMTISDDSNVGMGIITPGSHRLYVTSSDAGTSGSTGFFKNTASTGISMLIENSSTTASDLALLVSTRGTGDIVRFDSYHGNNTWDVEFRFDNDGDGYCDNAWHGGGADYAEYFSKADTTLAYEPGDIIMMSPNKTYTVDGANNNNPNLILGVYSSNPAMVGNSPASAKSHDNDVLVGLMGVINTKVNTENGAIKIGDYITISSTEKVGMKATKSGMVIGRAIDNYNSKGTGFINVLVEVDWYYNTDKGDITSSEIKDTFKKQQNDIDTLKAEIKQLKQILNQSAKK